MQNYWTSFNNPFILLTSNLIPTSFKWIFIRGGEEKHPVCYKKYKTPYMQTTRRDSHYGFSWLFYEFNSCTSWEVWDNLKRLLAVENVVRFSERRANIISIACSHNESLYTLITADNAEYKNHVLHLSLSNFSVLWNFNS